MCEDFALNFGDKELALTSQQHTSFSIREFLTKDNMSVVPRPPYSPDFDPVTFPFLRLKILPF
jgi:transposase